MTNSLSEDFSDQATEDEESVKQGLDYMYQNRFALHQQDSWVSPSVKKVRYDFWMRYHL